MALLDGSSYHKHEWWFFRLLRVISVESAWQAPSPKSSPNQLLHAHTQKKRKPILFYKNLRWCYRRQTMESLVPRATVKVAPAARFRCADPKLGAVLSEGKRGLCKRSTQDRIWTVLKSPDLKCSFFGHITDTVSRSQERRDAKELIKGSRQFLASEHCVFLLHISGQTHCLSQAKREARGENHTVKIHNGLRDEQLHYPSFTLADMGSTDGVSKTVFCPTIIFQESRNLVLA